jgi:hypothetical protein
MWHSHFLCFVQMQEVAGKLFFWLVRVTLIILAVWLYLAYEGIKINKSVARITWFYCPSYPFFVKQITLSSRKWKLLFDCWHRDVSWMCLCVLSLFFQIGAIWCGEQMSFIPPKVKRCVFRPQILILQWSKAEWLLRLTSVLCTFFLFHLWYMFI